MPKARRREVKAIYGPCSIAFDAVDGRNVALDLATVRVVQVDLDRIYVAWNWRDNPYPFKGFFKVRGLLSVFGPAGDVLFESEAEVYQNGMGGCFFDRHWPERQGRLLLTTED